MIDKKYNYAIVGASSNVEKYGFKVLKDLFDAGYKVHPINPKGGSILELTVYENLEELNKALDKIHEKIDVVIFIVPPEITLKILNDVRTLNIANVWMQPGSSNELCEEFCSQNSINFISNTCIMIQRPK